MSQLTQRQIVGYQHGRLAKVGVLLVNLGTPEAPTARALRPYLRQFLSDRRVIELNRILWWFILNCIVLVTRPRKSAELYRKIWTADGSPLLVHTKRQAELLAVQLRTEIGTPLDVDFAMRYGNPSVPSVLERMRSRGVERLLVLPLYPQYSATTTGSSFDAVVDTLKSWRWIPEFRMVMHYHDHPRYIAALAGQIRALWERDGRPDKLVVSFHGTPLRYLEQGDPYFCHCQKTARLIAESLGIDGTQYIVTFQSLFGREEWLRPYTDETLKALPAQGAKRVDVICPGFTADCLETLEEIDELNRHNFMDAGGKRYRYIPCLNEDSTFIQALTEIALVHLSGWTQSGAEWDEATIRQEAAESYARFSALSRGE